MSMSTRIEDLPGSLEEDEIIQDPRQFDTEYDHQLDNLDSNQSNIKMDIKKRVRFKEPLEEIEEDDEGIIEYLKSQINEENLLIFVLLFVSSRTEFDNYMTKIPLIGSYTEGSSILTNIFKALILLFIYILSKKFLIPSVKL